MGLGIIGEPMPLSGSLAQQLAEIGMQGAGLRVLRNPSIKPVAIRDRSTPSPGWSHRSCSGP